MMTSSQWIAEVTSRIAISEGSRTRRYYDTLNVPTIGIGFNLARADANMLLLQVGSSLAHVNAGAALTGAQVERLFALAFAPIIVEARGSLEPTHFDALSDARRFVLCDLVYNLGAAGWSDFAGTRAAIDQGCHFNALGLHPSAHERFGVAADHLAASAWFAQVGDRARRNVAMLRSSDWVDASGNGNT